MFHSRYEDKIKDLEDELREAEDYEEDDEYADDDLPEEEYDEEDEFDQEGFYADPRSSVTRYRRGSEKKFCDEAFFDKDLDDSEVYYKKDYKKEKRKKRRKAFAMTVLALAELAAFGGILLWFMSWMQ